jgi:hypothetical protein
VYPSRRCNYPWSDPCDCSAPVQSEICDRFSPTKSAALTTILGFIVIGFTLALVVNLLIKGSGSIFAPRFWTIFSEFLHNKVVEKIPN